MTTEAFPEPGCLAAYHLQMIDMSTSTLIPTLVRRNGLQCFYHHRGFNSLQVGIQDLGLVGEQSNAYRILLRYDRKSRHRRIKKQRRYERLAATSQFHDTAKYIVRCHAGSICADRNRMPCLQVV